MEPHPLWEYPSYPLSDVFELFTIDFTEALSNRKIEEICERCVRIDLKHDGILNGVAIWHRLELDDEDETLTIDTGLIEKPAKNKHLKWSRDFKQAVHIFENKVELKPNTAAVNLDCFIKFETKQGKFNIDFKTNK